MHLYCGIDWATEHHDVAVVDDDGRVVARATRQQRRGRLRAVVDAAGRGRRHRRSIRSRWGSKPIAACGWRALRETGRVIYPINPLAASRYRARYAVSGAKSDATDAVLLANIVRTDPDAHRPLPADTEAGPGDPGARPRPARRGVGAPADRQPNPRPAQGLLPGRARRVRRPARGRAGPPRCPHRPGRRTRPQRRPRS